MWFTLFIMRIYQKELSLMQKDGWAEYSSHSWVLIPKINGRTIDSIIIYGLSVVIAYMVYSHGGMKASGVGLKQLQADCMT